MSDDLILLIMTINAEFQMLEFAYKTKNDTLLGRNWQYWAEQDILSIYRKLFGWSEDIRIIGVREINGILENKE